LKAVARVYCDLVEIRAIASLVLALRSCVEKSVEELINRLVK